MLGLFAFFYGTLHLLTYVVLDQFFDFPAMVEDVLDRRYITAGMLAYLCILPLALTSTRTWMRRLGRRWQSLHRIVYVGAAAGVVHYLWLVKADLVPPLLYATVLAALLGYRWWHRGEHGQPANRLAVIIIGIHITGGDKTVAFAHEPVAFGKEGTG